MPLTIEQVALAHFKYLQQVEDFCEGKGEFKPKSPMECDFGRWVEEKKKAGEEVPKELLKAHEEFHRLTERALELKGKDPDEVRRCLDQAYALFAKIEHLLNVSGLD